jgi:hypothetical protein
MEVFEEEKQATKIVDIICKTAQIDKNPKFDAYLTEEYKIIDRLRDT